MQAIGDTLREARMRQKIDMSEVESATKIRAKYLRALENEEFELLPGPTFVRSFLRTYAEYLGLDPHLLVEAYRSQYEPRPDEPDLQPFAQQRRRRGQPPPRRGPEPRRRGALMVLLGIGLLAFFLILGLTGGEDEPESGRTSDQGSERSPERERGQGESGREEEQAPARRVTLRVAPVEATYVCVDNGRGRTLFEGTISEPRTWRGRRLRINMGKQSASVRVNGRRVALDGGPNPVGFDFTPSRREELPAGERPCA